MEYLRLMEYLQNDILLQNKNVRLWKGKQQLYNDCNCNCNGFDVNEKTF